MIKFRKKLLAVLLTAAMLISMSSVVAWSDEQPADEQTTQTEQTTEEDNASDGEEDSNTGKEETDRRYDPGRQQPCQDENGTGSEAIQAKGIQSHQGSVLRL